MRIYIYIERGRPDIDGALHVHDLLAQMGTDIPLRHVLTHTLGHNLLQFIQ